MCLVPVGGADIPVREILLRAQVRLRQRRTTKRDTGFLADDHESAFKTFLADSGGGCAPGLAAAHNHHRGRTPLDQQCWAALRRKAPSTPTPEGYPRGGQPSR
jgi:hypothetical protein